MAARPPPRCPAPGRRAPGRVHERAARGPGPGAGDAAGGDLSRPDPESDPEPDVDEDSGELLRWPTYALVAALVAVVALVTVWAAGLQTSAPAPTGTGASRLGPESGEVVADYLRRVREVPPPDSARLGLVQFTAEVDADTAAAAVAGPGVAPLQGVYRLPLPRVQTAVRRLPLVVVGEAPGATAAAIRAAQTQAANQARAQARRGGIEPGAAGPGGRTAAIAAVEADALAARCACVLALVVRAEPAAWPAVSSAPGVRAVEIAGPSARPQALAVSPLLPEQRDVVGPVPDDGPVN